MIDNKEIPVGSACKALQISRGSYYQWRNKTPGLFDNRIVEEIRSIVLEFSRYGYRRVTKELQRRNWNVNHKKVLRIMKEQNLLCKKKKSFKLTTTDSDHNKPVFPNLAKNKSIKDLNQLWVADITYVALNKGFAYLAAIIDVFSRRCIGWALDENLYSTLAIEALNMAINDRQHIGFKKLVHHSDRGVQYASKDYTDILTTHGIKISMSRKGNPYDNAYAESFMKTLKNEEVNIKEYENLNQAIENIQTFIEEVYNKKRLHSGIGYLPPEEFEKNKSMEALA